MTRDWTKTSRYLTAMATANDLSVTFGQLELDFELKFGFAQSLQVTAQYNFFLE